MVLNRIDTILVIAHKYNDILYAITTEEYKISKRKILLILYSTINPQMFPFQDFFDERHYIEYDKTKYIGLLMTLGILWKKFYKLHVDIVIFSNPVLVVNQYVVHLVSPCKVILLEDGLMNYYEFTASASITKKLLQSLLRVNNNLITSKISTTYLLEPQLAKYFYGVKKKIEIDIKDLISLDTYNYIEGKTIFVGQDLYNYFDISIPDYSTLVNRVIKKFHIEYYLPHPFASEQEDVHASYLSLNSQHVTLEMLSSVYIFSLYSFGSSVLYTTKCVNPLVKAYLVDSFFYANNTHLEMIKRCCDEIVAI